MNRSIKHRLLWLATLTMPTLASAYTPPTEYLLTQQVTGVNSAVLNGATGTILATMASRVGQPLGNTVTEISLSGDILRSTFIGSEPGPIALAADGSTAYVGMYGGSYIRRYDTVTGSVGPILPLPPQGSGAAFARDIEISPTDKDTVVVLTNAGIVAYSNDRLLPDRLTSYDALTGSITFGADGSTLYGYDNESSGFSLHTFGLNDSGVHLINTKLYAFWGYRQTISYDNGLIYKSSGEVYDPILQIQIGRYQDVIAVMPDSAAGVVYGLSQHKLTVYDQDTFTPLASYETGLDLSGYWDNVQLLKLGQGDIGIVGSSGEVSRSLYILRAIPEPSMLSLYALGSIMLMACSRQLKKTAR